MAQQTRIILIDGSEATQTVVFSYQGASYEIDLNDEHATALEESFHDWIEAARKIGAPGRTQRRSATPVQPKRRDLADVRAWAREQGHDISDRGRVSMKIVEAYDAAH